MTVQVKISLIRICLLAAFVASLLATILLKLDFEAFPVVETDHMEQPGDSVLYNIDVTGISRGTVYVSGWATMTDEDINTVNCWVLLRDTSTGISRKMKTESVYREGIAEALGTEKRIENCGFNGYVDAGKLDGEEYQVLICYRNNDHNILIETSTYINSGGQTIEKA